MRRIYKCLECGGKFTAFIYRYDSSPRGDDESVCPVCRQDEGFEEVKEEEE